MSETSVVHVQGEVVVYLVRQQAPLKLEVVVVRPPLVDCLSSDGPVNWSWFRNHTFPPEEKVFSVCQWLRVVTKVQADSLHLTSQPLEVGRGKLEVRLGPR